ncbi:hypothetical protein MMB75_05050 [Paenibacillus sp. P2(2022)]|uniref:hypothetical protein n=1 Tax=Paenibacillus TaxID=44249 RepID=UPI001C9D9714|nr:MULTISPECIES: hypothetical protein [Paenibacillus]MBY7736307.1 hypothetical protein [Paenibacillus polymyxa]MBY7740110.1 hypothetical protein [Paenibacillus polymyxa]MDG0053039.1 hypothetical protein [Paenibacillus sp. P2(2022)]MEE4578790.1 hypothetical protein [Paenibacillus polymyxa]
MTEQEMDEFTTALVERYVDIQKFASCNSELLNIWNEAIDTLPPEIKHNFEEKYNRLARESSS